MNDPAEIAATRAPGRIRPARKIGLIFLTAFLVGLPWTPVIKAEPGVAPTTEAGESLAKAREAAAAMDYQSARSWLERAREQAARRGDVTGEASTLLEMATILRHSGAADRALEPVQEAVALLENSGHEALLADAMTRRAEALEARGQKHEAARDLEKARELYRRLGDGVGVARVAATESVLASRRGDFDQALRSGRAALEQADDVAALRALSAVAYSEHHLGLWGPAQGSYDRLIELAWRQNDQRTLSFAYCNRAEVAWELGAEKPAVEDLWQVVERLEQGRGRTAGSAGERAAFLDREIAAYDRLVRYLVDRGDIEAAFGVAERLHGRSLLDRLSDVGARGDSPSDAQARDLVERLGRARLALERAAPEKKEIWKAEIYELERSLRGLEARAPARASSRAAEPSAVQAALEPGEALISYWSAEDRLIAWVISRDRLRLVQVPVSRQRLGAKLDRYLAPMRSASRAADQALLEREAEHLEAGRDLYEWLVAPLGEPAKSAERWVIIPDGRLHELPFEALVAGCRDKTSAESGDVSPVHGDYSLCRFLGQERSLTYSPSAGVMIALRERLATRDERTPGISPRRSLLAFAPAFTGDGTLATQRANRGPLRHNADEVRRIGRLFEDSRLLLGDQAREARLRDDLGSYRRLHLATHGLVDEELPLGAGLLLAAGTEDDGILLIPEVLGLDLAADLVTLSACRTGRGRPSRAEGLMGLSRAFLAAGASALVVSLWDVDDRSTALLMEAFYRHLAAGERPADALRLARSWLIDERGETRLVFKKQAVSYAHPRYWAGFVVVGAD